jgi:hypothetical protein
MLWSKSLGMDLFRETLARDRFKFILHCLRFDSKTSRKERVELDKFTHIRSVFHKFTDNCSSVYVPNFSLTVDEQLMPLKSRCPFIMFMANKPDKFGLKFWLLVEVKTKYIIAMIPYLGKSDQPRPPGRSLSEDVVLRLAASIQKKGYNLTMDNFFTSLNLAKQLQAQGTSVVGTMRECRRELPKEFAKPEKNSLYASWFYKHQQSGAILCKYQCKAAKTVTLLSTMHTDAVVEDNSEKKKPEIIHSYNKNKVSDLILHIYPYSSPEHRTLYKYSIRLRTVGNVFRLKQVGVDAVDAMARLYSTKCACRRWPVAVWCNMLDMAGINAWIVYKNSTGSTVSRLNFLFELVNELRQGYAVERKATLCGTPGQESKRKLNSLTSL